MKARAQILFESSKGSGIILPRNNLVIAINENIKLYMTFLISEKRIIRIRLSETIIPK